jgi:hypothetical protein
MPHSPDDTHLPPDQRRRKIASILAKGVLRLHRTARTARNSADPDAAEHAPVPAPKDLEVSATSRPHVTTG